MFTESDIITKIKMIKILCYYPNTEKSSQATLLNHFVLPFLNCLSSPIILDVLQHHQCLKALKFLCSVSVD